MAHASYVHPVVRTAVTLCLARKQPMAPVRREPTCEQRQPAMQTRCRQMLGADPDSNVMPEAVDVFGHCGGKRGTGISLKANPPACRQDMVSTSEAMKVEKKNRGAAAFRRNDAAPPLTLYVAAQAAAARANLRIIPGWQSRISSRRFSRMIERASSDLTER